MRGTKEIERASRDFGKQKALLELAGRFCGLTLGVTGRRLTSIRTLALLEDPSVRLIGDLGYQRQLISTERRAGFPTLVGLVNSAERNVVARANIGLVQPDYRFTFTQSDFVYGWFFV